MNGNEMLREAVYFATTAHNGQHRHHPSDMPYIAHPIAVGTILLNYNAPIEAVVAGFLHDVVEDTDVSLSEIEDKFGSEVTALVGHVTEDKSLPWRERNIQLANQYRKAPLEAKLVGCADKFDNLRSYDTPDAYPWGKVQSKEKQAWKYGIFLEALVLGPASLVRHELFQETVAAYETVFGRVSEEVVNIIKTSLRVDRRP